MTTHPHEAMRKPKRLIVPGDKVAFSEEGYINVGEVTSIEKPPEKETVYSVWSLNKLRKIHRRQIKKVFFKPCFRGLEYKTFKEICVTKEGVRFSGDYGSHTIKIGEFDEALLGGKLHVVDNEVRRAFWEGGWMEDFRSSYDPYDTYRKVFGVYRYLIVWVCNPETSRIERFTITVYKRFHKKHDKPTKTSLYAQIKRGEV